MNRSLNIFTVFFLYALWFTGPIHTAIIPLAPYDETFVSIKDFFLIFSIPSYEEKIKRIKVYFDRDDISKDIRILGNTVSFIPDQDFINRPDLKGPHIVTIIVYGPYRDKLDTYILRFYLHKKDTVSDDEKLEMIEKGKKIKGVRIQEFVNNGILYSGIDYESYLHDRPVSVFFDAHGNGYRGKWFYNYNLLLDSDEQKKEQTLQRFRLATGYTKNLQISFGDNWPSYNKFLLDGLRVRGIEINLKSPKRSVNFDYVYGQAKRAVEPDPSDNINGTYNRKMIAGRLQFGSGRIIKYSIDFIKAKDDSSSINLLYLPVIDLTGDTLINNLTNEPFTYMNPNIETPKDNIALGTDFQCHIWKRRITLYGNYALSFRTDDILGGPITEEEISSLTNAQVSLPIKPEKFDKFLIINGSTKLIPVPSNSSEKINIKILRNIMAYDAGIRITFPYKNVWDQFEFNYFFIGPEYKSFGKEYLSANKTGFSITNETQLMNGKIYLKNGFQYFKDDMYGLKSKPAKKYMYNLLFNIMWNNRLPYFTFFIITNNEETEVINQNFPPERENAFNQYGTTIQYSKNFAFSKHSLALTYNYSNNRSNTYLDSSFYSNFTLRGNNVNLSLNTQYDKLPIVSRISFFTFYSKGFQRIKTFSPSLGLSWFIIPEKLDYNTDITYNFTKDKEKKEAVNKVTTRSSLTFDMSTHHSLYFEARLDKRFKSGNLDSKFLLTYEYRY
ncbi:MAG: hypothetical protein PVI26_01480 [Chitinispirillia bacterium]|jgi:hypothetical protein